MRESIDHLAMLKTQLALIAGGERSWLETNLSGPANLQIADAVSVQPFHTGVAGRRESRPADDMAAGREAHPERSRAYGSGRLAVNG